MIELMQNSHRIALIENPVWIYKLPNGDFGLTDREHAQGLTYNGTVYNIGIGGLGDEYEYASANEINGGEAITDAEAKTAENAEAVAALEDAICDAEINTAEWRSQIEDALCEIEEGEAV